MDALLANTRAAIQAWLEIEPPAKPGESGGEPCRVVELRL
jgi:hypothetical protein